MRDPYPKHGRRWRPWTPLRFVCRCGTDAYPCPAERARQAVREREARAAIQLYAAGRRAAAGWQRAERRNWARRS